MPFVTPPLLKMAVDALSGKHPLAVAILPAMVRNGVRVIDPLEKGTPYGSNDEVELLEEFFRIPGGPQSRPFRAVWEAQPSHFWRDQRYPGRSFQRIRVDRAGRQLGLVQQKTSSGKDLWGLTKQCGPELLEEVKAPIALIDLAIWYGRHWDAKDLNALIARFLEEFPLNQDALVGTIYTELIPSEYLAHPFAEEPIPLPELQKLLAQTETPSVLALRDGDPILNTVQDLFIDGYAGVIFSGPPGTSKSWYAYHIAYHIAEYDLSRVRLVQFHASYQYEDFVEGYVPDDGGFVLQPKHLLEMCNRAYEVETKPCFIVIDELSRSDPARVFGEALTYIETTRRDIKFQLASGTQMSIPSNLFFIATMNQFDKGVEQVDLALERRFARIQMDPDIDRLGVILTENGVSDDLKSRIIRFFNFLQSRRDESSKIGHAYFHAVTDEETLRRLWDYQLKFRLQRANALNPNGYLEIERQWQQIFSAG